MNENHFVNVVFVKFASYSVVNLLFESQILIQL